MHKKPTMARSSVILTLNVTPRTSDLRRNAISAEGDGVQRNWGYNNRGAYVERVTCFLRLYDRLVDQPRRNYSLWTLNENMADISGMRLTLAALKNDDCYQPDAPSREGNFTEQQIFFIAYCRLLCSSKKSIDSYVTVSHPRSDHRCNVVLSQMPEFRSAFGCPALQTAPCSVLN